MNKFNSDEIKRILLNCAKLYESKLKNKEFLILYKDRDSQTVKHCEILFQGKNFQHLAGIIFVDKDGNERSHNSAYFYQKCLEQKIGASELKQKNDGTTLLKLSVLPSVMDFSKLARIIGSPGDKYSSLNIELSIGGINCCLGLRYDNDLNHYVPVSVLSEDIRKVCRSTSQILAIFEREYQHDSKEPYKTIRHVAKGVNIENIIPESITNLISINNDDK